MRAWPAPTSGPCPQLYWGPRLNPALPLLVGLTLGGLALRRWGWHRPVLICGLAAIALLSAALVQPDGIPSPAGDLAHRAPWTGAVPAVSGNPAMQDVTFQIYPWLLYLRQEVRAGRWPFWNPHQFSGMTFWGNGQSAPLSPFHLLFAALPLQIGFLFLPFARILVGGAGAYALARELGRSPPAAAVAAAVFPLSGMLTSFLLFPMANALALVPWIFWAVERLAQGKSGWPTLGLLAALQLLAGHPETSLHTALLVAIYSLARAPLREQSWRHWWRLAAGWGAAALASAVVLLPLAVAILASSRWQQAGELGGGEPALSLLWPLPLRLVLPDLFGNPAQGTWWGPFNYLATAVYAGALALPLAAAGMVVRSGDRRRIAWIALLVFSAAAAYHTPGLTQVLDRIPLLGSALQHRLLFGVELALAVLAGFGVDAWLAGRGRAGAWGIGFGLVLLLAAALRYWPQWAANAILEPELRFASWVLVLWVVYVLSLTLAPASRTRWAWALAPLFAVDLVAAHRGFNPAQRLGDLYPRTGATEFLRRQTGRVVATGDVLRPNAAMVYGLDDVRGDDPLKPKSYEDVLSELGTHHPAYFTPVETWSSPWLDRLGVRWVMTPPGDKARETSWGLAYDGADARVFERPGALPSVRWASSEIPAPRFERPAPSRWNIDVSGGSGRLVVAEGWDAGWVARVDGRAVTLERGEGSSMQMEIAAGERELSLSYRPAGITLGAVLSVCGSLLLGLGWKWHG